ncbi:4-aminobutyrate--2-oxoglutarate transaminase [Microcella sp.]|uniref:4-aminobutyrate--2-oxoglutarate transaminase n=1 Tax=Microcella sp. TaxID=1913979 RepID=UPI00299F5B22|nr:4-aminobutyrate--2-oxoglutarate transaminase [Microcella sp.]MDX2025455.1 4-aminobutyrate--2-oxoglutarate transaminase [Microcella sp.]
MTDTLSAPAAPSFEGTGSAHAPVAQERRVVTAIPGPASQALHERRLAVVSAGVGTALPVYIDRAHDAIVVDVDGNHFIDLGGGIGVMGAGHTNDAVVAAVQEQVAKVTHTLFTVTPYEQYVRVAELLVQHTPGDHAKKVVLVNSGAEALENAVKIARKHTGRAGVAVLDHGYHGRTNLTMAMNFKAMPYNLGFGPFASNVYHAPSSYPLHDGLSGAEAARRTISYLEKRVGADDLACLVVEPIQGEGGFIVPAEGYLPALVEWCRANGVVFIADEVQSGVARTGAYYASEHFDIVPDMITTAKGIAGGMVLAGVVGRAEIMDSSHAGGLGGTYGGNPVACAAAIAVFDQIDKRNLLGAAQHIETVLRPALEALAAKQPRIAEVRGIGAMLAIEFLDPETHEPDAAIVSRAVAAAAQQGVLLLSAGTYGNVIRFLPPLTISDELLLEAVEVLDAALSG